MIDKQQALDLLDRAVHQDGYGEDYVYPDEHKVDGLCRYVYDDKPSCLVGHALHLSGVSVETLRTLENSGPHNFDWSKKGVSLTPDAAYVFGNAQEYQDAGSDWGTALDEARKV